MKLTTDDGAELATEQLIYRGDKKLAKSELATAFKRGTLSGTSKGFEYQSEEGRLDLQADVVIHVTPQGRPPLDIRSASARPRCGARSRAPCSSREGYRSTRGPTA